MKTVYPTGEIAHLWAHATQASARNGHGNNFSFDGGNIRSYSTTIGRRLIVRGEPVFICDRETYSKTTAKHVQEVWSATHGPSIFGVRCGWNVRVPETGKELRDHFLGRFAEINSEAPSRYAHIRAERFCLASEILADAIRACNVFGLGFAKLEKIEVSRADELEKSRIVKDDHSKALSERREARRARKHAAMLRDTEADGRAFLAGNRDWFAEYRISQLPEEIQEPVRAKLAADKIEKERAELEKRIESAGRFLRDDPSQDWFYSHMCQGFPQELTERVLAKIESNRVEQERLDSLELPAKIERWREGKRVSLPSDLPVMLRAEGEEMATSRGARVPLDHAKRGFEFAARRRAITWHKNGERCQLGNYELDAVNEQGVVAGCHRVSWAEIEAFASSQGWHSPEPMFAD